MGIPDPLNPFDPPAVVDDEVDSIPNGNYLLTIKGLDEANTIFLSFVVPTAGDTGDCAECLGDVTQLTLQNDGNETDVEVTDGVNPIASFSNPPVPNLGIFTFDIPPGTQSVDVNGTSIPTFCGPGDDDDDDSDSDSDSDSDGDDDDDGPPDVVCEPIGQGSVFGPFTVVEGVSEAGEFCPDPVLCGDDDDDDYDGHSDCFEGSGNKLRSLTLQYTADECTAGGND